MRIRKEERKETRGNNLSTRMNEADLRYQESLRNRALINVSLLSIDIIL
jgi:hypothetical protein